MSTTEWLVAALLVAAAAAVVWPMRSSRARRRALLGQPPPHPAGGAGAPDAGRPVRDPAPSGARPAWATVGPCTPGPPSSRSGPTGHRPSSGPAGHRPSPGPTGHRPSVGPAGAYGPAEPGGRSGPPGRRDPRRPAGALLRSETPPHPGPSTVPPRDGAGGGGRARLSVAGLRSLHVPAWLSASPRRTPLVGGVAGAASGAVLAGPVAAVVVGAYGALAVRGLLRRRLVRQAQLARRRSLDQLCALAADLRAGVPVLTAAASLPVDPAAADRLGRLARAAVQLADRTGAPLADLLERIEADARATDRGLAAAAAQAAGSRATAWLLAALPLGGIGLGYGVGVDPVAVLLHTPVGGGCAVAAVVLQLAGLFWAERLGAAPDGSR
ncbi:MULTISPECIES: type II secretion system F family protein [unclassified Micromonospora]|uniref:type II secretion system F family protein n=1 Tax=unclassified Micromonospora TaxID=2617518 RepID=UPI0009CC4BCC|nr:MULTISPECIES: hypothetical protein [unclassified Micromonospora]OON32755.1 hypothetical protein BSA16_04000 [Micromonospora sp. Rc5]